MDAEPQRQDEPLADRVGRFVLISASAGLAVLLLALQFGSAETVHVTLLLVPIHGAMLVVLYILRRSRYLTPLVFANLLGVALLVAAAEPLSGGITGNSWVLFQIPPLLAALILDRPRHTLLVAGLSSLLLGTMALLVLSGSLPIPLVEPARRLLLGLGFQLLALVLTGLTLARLARRAQRALAASEVSRLRLEQQITRMREVLLEKDQLNREQERSLADIRTRDQQLEREREQQLQLRRTIQQLSAPVIPVLEGVVVMPLVGEFDAQRAEHMSQVLLSGVQRYRAKIVVIDVTGVRMLDGTVAQSLMQAADASTLLGVTPILVGISPEAAETLVGLGIDLRTIITRADLKAGVEYALSYMRQTAKVSKP